MSNQVFVVQGPAGEIGSPGQQGNPGVEVSFQHNVKKGYKI